MDALFFSSLVPVLVLEIEYESLKGAELMAQNILMSPDPY